jgi:MarR family transcriptional regulator, 2-MHQ and catechol-resistance regulon repressor
MAGKKTSEPSTCQDAFRSLLRVFGLLRRTMETFFAVYGISGGQWGVLVSLHMAAKEGVGIMRLTDISERLLIRPPSVTTVIDRLERMGLVKREASAEDSRAKEVRLTPAGQELVERVLEKHGEKIREVLGGLSWKEQADFKRLLDKSSEHLESLAEKQEVPDIRP